MKIVMFTNTYTPHVGGVAGSVEQLVRKCRSKGHQIYVVAPEFPEMPEDEKNVIRTPAIQNFNGSDFSVSLPIPSNMRKILTEFNPDIIHTHHPYLLGDAALRYSAYHNLPLVFTHHTMYEKYTHYVPTDSPAMRRFVIELTRRYVNLCDHIIAPSDSVAKILEDRGAETDITVIPTGVDYNKFSSGDGAAVRNELGIPSDAFVIGHVGRLAPEKNLAFLAKAVTEYLKTEDNGYFIVVGNGPSRENMQAVFQGAGVADRVHFMGTKQAQELVNFYHSMDVMAFTSKSETQGMVLAEAMAAGVPVVALDAPGARDIVKNNVNGFLVQNEEIPDFIEALEKVNRENPKTTDEWQQEIDKTAREFSAGQTTRKVLKLYDSLIDTGHKESLDDETWEKILRAVKLEWEIWEKRIAAGAQSIGGNSSDTSKE